jgi:hypothetical protein
MASLPICYKNINIKINGTIILPVVLYGCETWSLMWWEESSLRVFGNRVQRIFGPKRDELAAEWRRLHNELNDLYSSPTVMWVSKSRWAGLCHVWGEEKGI